MPSYVTPKKNTAYVFTLPGLTDQADTKRFKANPTLAAGDIIIYLDGVLLGNIGTLPSIIGVTPALHFSLTAAEMNADNILIQCIDVAGAEWCDVGIIIQTSARQVDDLSTLTTSQVNAEVVDALAIDTYAEPGQGTPPATASLTTMNGYLYKAWRNKHKQTSDQYSLYNNGGTVIDQKATVSDASGTTTIGEVTSGP